jgi:hypothetical protein
MINNNKILELQTCCICLEEQSEQNIEAQNNNLITYNHCGTYYVHKYCLNKWKLNQCFICRENLYEENIERIDNNSGNYNDLNYLNESEIFRIFINNNERRLYYQSLCGKICIILNLCGIGIYFIVSYH